MIYRIRPATPEDAEALVDMHAAALEESYRSLMPQIAFHTVGVERNERIQRCRSFLNGTDPHFLAHDGAGSVVGFAESGPGRDKQTPCTVELYRIYTLARTHGSGLGSDLLEACISDAAAYLWVLEQNPRAQAFYAKHGFRPDGTRKRLPAAFNELPEIRMVRPAGCAPRASQQSS
ncbi:GNAT family N-acetyltransferase [Arthrobacter rhombi]|uniref:GNAT family N-acetyltransferase n=1 Tax=Arthrobacter rhombi TaxID=71253 RepID=UPI003FD1BCC0